jgi:hypothetical protein
LIVDNLTDLKNLDDKEVEFEEILSQNYLKIISDCTFFFFSQVNQLKTK